MVTSLREIGGRTVLGAGGFVVKRAEDTSHPHWFPAWGTSHARTHTHARSHAHPLSLTITSWCNLCSISKLFPCCSWRGAPSVAWQFHSLITRERRQRICFQGVGFAFCCDLGFPSSKVKWWGRSDGVFLYLIFIRSKKRRGNGENGTHFGKWSTMKTSGALESQWSPV